MSIFSKVPLPKISRSTHPLNHTYKFTGDAGVIYPVMCELSFAGDDWRVDLEQFVRSMPMIAPIMDMVDVKVDAFFCPIRLVWDDFEDWVTLGPTGEAAFDWPTLYANFEDGIDATHVARLKKLFYTGGLADYLNFPTEKHLPILGQGYTHEVDALPFRVYQLIQNEYYLNENLDTPIPINHASGRTLLTYNQTGDNAYRNENNFFLRNRGWNKDYYTSALPFPQKGPQVRLPQADVTIGPDGPLHLSGVPSNPNDSFTTVPGDPTYSSLLENETRLGLIDKDHPVDSTVFSLISAQGSQHSTTYSYEKGLKATAVDLPTIEELRYTECLQEFYEANARGGSRPKEYYRNIWHTNTKDARLDRPEYLGGYRGPVTITDIDQTSESNISAQGTPAGKGVSAGGNKIIRYHCSEHGYLMVTFTITPRSSYYQGYRKMNLYRDVFDFPNPFFANLGEQEIKNLELYDDPSDGYNDGTFGYTPRYAEAKFIPSTVHGQLRSTLNYWTLVRQFNSRPNLNSNFVHIQPSEISRIFPDQVTNNDKFVVSLYFHVKRRMYLPYWGIPRLIHSI